MAEWRIRKYVPDSDEGENDTSSIDIETLTSSNPKPKLTPTDFLHIDELAGEDDSESWERNRLLRQETFLGVNFDGGNESGNSVERDTRTIGRADNPEHDMSTGFNTSALHLTSKDIDQEHNDVDELQLDHYRATPAAQLVNDLLKHSQIDKTGSYLSSSVKHSTSLNPGVLSSELHLPSLGALTEISPLSSPLTEPPSTPPAIIDRGTRLSEEQAKRPNSLNIISPSERFTCQQSQNQNSGKYASGNSSVRVETRQPERAFRQRNPIQLRPYALEDERYRQSLKARGLKPLRITQALSVGGDSVNAGSQEHDFELDADSQPHETLGTSVAITSSPPPHRLSNKSHSRQATPNVQWGADEGDFPDLDTTSRQKSPETEFQGFKRRKTAHTYSWRRHQGTSRTPALPAHTVDLSSQTLEPLATNTDSIFDVPPSPPHTDSSSPPRSIVQAADGFRYPPGAVLNQLQTPLASSESKKQQYAKIGILSDLEDESTAHESESEESSITSTPHSEDKDLQQLRRVQRKIRGVLPASWLRLDLQTQKKSSSKDLVAYQHDAFPVAHDNQRGIARPILSSKNKDFEERRRRCTVVQISDDSSSEANDTQGFRNADPIKRSMDDLADEYMDTNVDLEFPDVIEDNSIDRMLTSNNSSSIPLTEPGHRRKKPSRKANSLRAKKSKGLFRENRGNRKRQLSISRHIIRQADITEIKPTFRPPRLGILDIVPGDFSERKATPDFLRVASRTVRTRLDAGRHSPSGKYLRLATLQDTCDVQMTLALWRAGSVVPSDQSSTGALNNYRNPLTPSSGNERWLSEISSPSIQATKNRRKSPRERPKSQSRWMNRSLEEVLRSNHQSALQCQITHSSQGDSKRIPPIVKSRYHKVGRGRILSSFQAAKGSRPALLESKTEGNGRIANQSATQSKSIRGTEDVNLLNSEKSVLERFLSIDDSALPAKSSGRLADDVGSKVTREAQVHHVKGTILRRRKRTPKHIDTTINSVRQCSELPRTQHISNQSSCTVGSYGSENIVLQELGPFGSHYTTTFDITPLPTGFSFSGTTLIGSGQFCRSLDIKSRNLDVPGDVSRIRLNDCSLELGPWTDAVSSQLGRVIDRVIQILRDTHDLDLSRQYSPIEVTEAISLQESVIQYFTNNLNFLDPIDRISCIQRCTFLLTKITDNLEITSLESRSKPNRRSSHRMLAEKLSIQCLTRVLVTLQQLHQIAMHELVSSALRDEVRVIMVTILTRTLSLTLSDGFDYIRSFYQNCLYSEQANCDDQYKIESFLVIYHIAKGDSNLLSIFSGIVQRSITKNLLESLRNARILERIWQDLFTFLPLLEVDAKGVLRTGQRYKEPHENWELVKLLVEPVLEVYIRNPLGQSPTFNVYLRANLGRCLYLIQGWGWRRCEMIIGLLFDFYAQNGLAHLQHEESHGSPLFLESLSEDTRVEYSQQDRGFHVLLKIIGAGLRGMRQVYPSKKIRDVAWRLMPNHGRYLLKDEAIRQQDLDALRNHHDLLCTLYWASPAGFRPRLSVIRNLVPFESSHREACHISIRTWSSLVRYQLSTNESLAYLEPFSEWHDDILMHILRLHKLARTEVEAQAKSAERTGSIIISRSVQESTIEGNQRQVEAILSDVLNALRNAVIDAQGLDTARILVTSSLSPIFDLFDTKQPRIDAIILHALDIILAFLGKFRGCESNEDSQGFGDWSGIDEILPQTEAGAPSNTFQDIVLDPLSRLLSNCFGADAAVDYSLLLKVVQTWVAASATSVHQGLKAWNDYLSPYGHKSWSSLRDTVTTRQFTAYFLATLINKDPRVYQEFKMVLIQSWIASLVERESLLKFQHALTETILNMDHANPLLANLPFWIDSETSRYKVSASDFTERRLSLISSILSNMRESLDFSIYHNLSERTTLKREYTDLLKHLMTTMKHNYQELGHGSNIKGAYVIFVQSIIGLLQQHTVEICPVDRFFTDSSAFPLPATDPTYVVGRLKNYKLRLQEARTSKQLSVFIQAVSERAAVDCQQQYLVKQLHTAMSNEYEGGCSAKLTLRSFLMQAIFPAYIGVSLSTSCGWLLAVPIIQASRESFDNIVQDLDGTSETSVHAMEHAIAVFLDAIQNSVGLLIDHSGLLEKATVLQTLRLYYSAIVALLPTLSYMSRLPFSTGSALGPVKFMRHFASFAMGVLSGHDDPYLSLNDGDEPLLLVTNDQLAGVRSFAMSELRETLSKNWVLHNEQYYLIKGNSRREVIVNVGSFEEEKMRFVAECGRYFDALCILPGFHEEDMDGLWRQRGHSGEEDLVF